MTWIISLVLGLLSWITGKKVNTDQQLGAEKASNESLREGQKDIRKANEAAKKVSKENPTDDPNNLDR